MVSIGAIRTPDPGRYGAGAHIEMTPSEHDVLGERELSRGALLTDLYQLTMMQAYYETGMTAPAAFEFFVRKLPPTRSFFLAAGLEQVLDYLEEVRFTDADIAWLRSLDRFSDGFLDRLRSFRFTGDVDALPEGTVFFPDEPVLRVAAPLPEAQLVETRIVNLLHLETLIASKAARFVLAAAGRTLVDFGLRRAHGAEAGLLAARAAYIAGFDGTATILAGERFGIPLYGTMAHSFVQAYDNEAVALERFARAYPKGSTLLIDTYDTEAAAGKVVSLAPRLREAGIRVAAVRIDSGDLGAHARQVRRILDGGGLTEVKIFASGGLDEYLVARLAKDAPIDGFGIGTNLVTSQDAPGLDCAYKLQEYAGRARRKRSEGKATWPGRKQVYRTIDASNRMLSDVLTLEGQSSEGVPLMQPVMRAGKRIAGRVPITEVRQRASSSLAQLPEALRGLTAAPAFAVQVAPCVRHLADEVDAYELAQRTGR
jgi:nicotinate phosphoribosyltransferase